MQVTIKFSLSTFSAEMPAGTTVQDLINDPVLREIGGWDENVKSQYPDDCKLTDGDVVTLRRSRNQKGYVGAILSIVGTVANGVTSGIKASQSAGGGGVKSPNVHLSQISPVDFNPTSTLPGFETGNQEWMQMFNEDFPELEQATNTINKTVNADWQKNLETLDPTLASSITSMGKNVNSLLNGAIPADVQKLVKQNAAYGALSGGFSGSSMANNLTAEDLGQTSLSLMQQGAGEQGQLLNYLAGLNPSNVSGASLMMTPAQLLNRQDTAAQYQNQLLNNFKVYNNNIANEQDIIHNTGSPMAASGAMSGIMSGLGSVASGLSSTGGSGGSNPLMALFSQFGNMFSQGSSGGTGSGPISTDSLPAGEIGSMNTDGSFN